MWRLPFRVRRGGSSGRRRAASWRTNSTAASGNADAATRAGDTPDGSAIARSRQALVGRLQLRLIHRMLDRHGVAGRPWDSALPPPLPARYSLRRQFRKRVPGCRPGAG